MERIEKFCRVEKAGGEPERMERINRLTLSPLGSEEVFTFRLAACDDQTDRDQERFTDRTLEGLAPLFVGKPILCDHHWSVTTQTARVYDAYTLAAEGGAKQLILECYMLRNDSTAPVIRAIEGGILRECSVGVQVEQALCSICGKRYDSADCVHFRGHVYDGRTCHVELDGAVDAYECSFVAVPAQRAAGVVKRYQDAERIKYDLEPQGDAAALHRKALILRLKLAERRDALRKEDVK